MAAIELLLTAQTLTMSAPPILLQYGKTQVVLYSPGVQAGNVQAALTKQEGEGGPVHPAESCI